MWRLCHRRQEVRNNLKRILVNRAAAGVGILLYLFLSFWHLDSKPALWWDEGWTLAAARNWVEHGYVGQRLDNVWQSPGLAAQVTVIAPVALSFRLLGVGPWQGRVPGVVFTAATLWLLFYLARRLYDPAAAWWTIAVALLVAPNLDSHPLILGRQVLGEMPMLCYLLAGYSCFLNAVERCASGSGRLPAAHLSEGRRDTRGPARERGWMLAAIGCWGLGLVAKLQGGPFFVLSLLVPMGASLLAHNGRIAARFGIGLIGALAMVTLIPLLESVLLLGRTQPVASIPGLWEVTALVTVPAVRFATLVPGALLWTPAACGLMYATWGSPNRARRGEGAAGPEMVRLAMTTLAASWLAWYVFLSVGFPRYLFPPLLIGSIALGVLLRDAARAVRASPSVRLPMPVGLTVVLALLAWLVPQTVMSAGRFFRDSTPESPASVAEFLNTATPTDALVETYDSELFFLLDRRYHYPPDPVHVELNRRSFLHQDVPIPYDPLAASPDYLVVGPFSRFWHLYDPVIATGAFRQIKAFPGYKIYERVRLDTTSR